MSGDDNRSGPVEGSFPVAVQMDDIRLNGIFEFPEKVVRPMNICAFGILPFEGKVGRNEMDPGINRSALIRSWLGPEAYEMNFRTGSGETGGQVGREGPDTANGIGRHDNFWRLPAHSDTCSSSALSGTGFSSWTSLNRSNNLR